MHRFSAPPRAPAAPADGWEKGTTRTAIPAEATPRPCGRHGPPWRAGVARPRVRTSDRPSVADQGDEALGVLSRRREGGRWTALGVFLGSPGSRPWAGCRL